MNIIKNQFGIEYPNEQKEIIKHALNYFPPFMSEHEESRELYSFIINTIYFHFDEDVVKELLWPYLQDQFPDTFESLAIPEYWVDINSLYLEAEKHGWSLQEYFNHRNYENGRLNGPKELPVPDSANVVMDNRYLDLNIGELYFSKDAIIHSAHGTGKTEFIINLLHSNQFIYITHREQLAKEVVFRLRNARVNVLFYNDLSDFELRNVDENIVICINSIFKLDLNRYKNRMIVIDEFDQFVNHIHGETCEKRQTLIFASFQYLISNSKERKFLSADFPPIALSFIRNVLKIRKLVYIFNKHLPNQDRDLFLYDKENLIISHLVNALEKGEKVSVASFSKEKVKNLVAWLSNRFGENKRIIYFDRESISEEEQSSLLQNKFLFEEYDAVLYSPVLSSGVDFNLPFSKFNYLLVNSKIEMDHIEAIQMAHRFRQFDELHLFCADKLFKNDIDDFFTEGNVYSEYFRVGLRDYMRNHKIYNELYSSKNITKKPVGTLSFIINSFLLNGYKKRILSNFYFNLVVGLVSRGYRVKFIDKLNYENIPLVKFYVPNKKTTVNKVYESFTATLSFERILSGTQISDVEFRAIKRKEPSSIEEMESLAIYEIKSVLAFDENNAESHDDLNFYCRSKMTVEAFKECLLNFGLLMSDLNNLKNIDLILNSQMESDQISSSIKRARLYKEIWKLIPSENFAAENLEGIVEFISANEVEISEIIFKITDIYKKEPVRFVSRFCRIIGIKLNSKQVTVKKNNVYWIVTENFFYYERILIRKGWVL
ncbi:plasmid replication protein, CyRepA1 family [Leptospira barantonii]|uniref:Helicase ATP-binding domain-containing protein n=1 Tax=Leptospira barantonii TaxID=2023184 RepID=A0ABX4NQY7_9LEPT|nr:plasmid replication protein, CyRepA1 family [Leptospira barantonii]PJZ58281.1 hypothetical protein CH367_07840 [Leptospira barantonii]